MYTHQYVYVLQRTLEGKRFNMKRIDSKKDKEEQNPEDIEKKRDNFISPVKVHFIIIALVLLIFIGIMIFTDILEQIGGKALETGGLVVIAVLLVALLYKTNRS